MDLSFIIPCDRFSYKDIIGYESYIKSDRRELLKNTLKKYEELLRDRTEEVEFIIVSRTIFDLRFLDGINLTLRLLIYQHDDREGFAPSKAFNLGIQQALADYIAITSPEVIPITNVIEQFFKLPKANYICKCIDQNQNGTLGMTLVDSKFRSSSPEMYFLAFYRKEDILKINGWDEEFMYGFGWEDNDFGSRFMRAGLKFNVRDDMVALHQYHPRIDLDISNSREKFNKNCQIFIKNNSDKLIRCQKGIFNEFNK